MSYFKKGEWNAICDVCGFQFKSGELKKRWDGFMVCKEDFEVRHPSDFIRTRPDRPAAPWSRPENDTVPTPIFWFTGNPGAPIRQEWVRDYTTNLLQEWYY